MSGVSVLLPIWSNDDPINLDLCLHSLTYGQTKKPDEVIVVCDGPLAPALEQVLEFYSSVLNEIDFNVIRFSEHVGLPRVLNKGLENCRNDIVLRMDADDICFPNRIEVQSDFMTKNVDVDIMGSDAIEINHIGHVLGSRCYPRMHRDIINVVWANPIIHPSVCFRANKIIELGGYDESRTYQNEDIDLWVRCAKAGLRFQNFPEPLIAYRVPYEVKKKRGWRVAFAQSKAICSGLTFTKAPIYRFIFMFSPFVPVLAPRFVLRFLRSLFLLIDPRQ